MSRAEHPLARRLQQRPGETTRLLAVVMGLPLVDGIFPALVVAGALDGALGVLQVGLLVFGGGATAAVLLSADEHGRDLARSVLVVGVALVSLAALEAVLAPTATAMLDVAVFQRFGGLVLVVVAARTASARVAEYLPGPGIIVALGVVASVRPEVPTLVFAQDPTLVGRGVAAALVGVLAALVVALLKPRLVGLVDVERFRFGSALALGVFGISMLGLFGNSPLPLAVLGIAILLSIDPSASEPEDASGTASAGKTSGHTEHYP